ncbi:hypothetical protein AC249_AIPGENE6640 [Exaiptasia diaphana]|nr:hypothetical protein AC249_AIPGENE6640 [Exaiptasia diaphana]
MWKKHDLHTAVIWDSKESVLSKMTPIFRAEEDDKMSKPRILATVPMRKGDVQLKVPLVQFYHR